MPYYQISITTANRKVHSGIREIDNQDINAVWRQYELKAKEVYGRDVIKFDCKMLSKLSPEARKFTSKKGKKDFKDDGLPFARSTKSRKESYNPKTTLGDRATEGDNSK